MLPYRVRLFSHSFQNKLEILGDQFIHYYGHKIAIVLSQDFNLAVKVANNIKFGYKNIYNGYALNVSGNTILDNVSILGKVNNDINMNRNSI